MSRLLLALLLATALACRADPAAPEGARPFAACGATPAYWPTTGFRGACPAAVGMDSAALRAAVDAVPVTMPTVLSVAVARRGYVVLEGYWHGTRASTPIDLRSVTKAVTATVVGAEVAHGRIAGTGQLARDFFPEYLTAPPDPRAARITVGHLLDLTAGFAPNSQGTTTASYEGWVLTRPMLEEPGTSWWYDESLYHLLSILVRRVDERGLLGAARDDVFGPLGMGAAARRWPVDPRGNAYGAGGLRLTTREMLELGELHRHDGVWDGTRILPDGWVAAITTRPEGVPDAVTYWSCGWRQTVLDGHLAYYALG